MVLASSGQSAFIRVLARDNMPFFGRASLLIVDEIGYLPVVPGGGNLFSSSSAPDTNAAPWSSP